MNTRTGAVDDPAERLTLADLIRCYEGAIPAVLCTADADGIPNITYISRVHPIDDERIAISNQFMSKSARNIAVNPVADLLLIDPSTYEQYRLTIRYERTERRGPVFEHLREDVEGLAALIGMQGVFRLRAADIFRVCAIERVGDAYPLEQQRTSPEQALAGLTEFVGRVERAPDLAGLVEVTLDGLDRLLGYRHVSLMLLDESGTRLYTIASRGFDEQNVGAEVVLGEGPIGEPLARSELRRVTGLRQITKYSRTVRSAYEEHGVGPVTDVPVPTLPDVNARIVVPLRALGQLVGGLVIEDRMASAFDASDERVLAVVGAVLGSALEHARLLGAAEFEPEPPGQTDVQAGAAQEQAGAAQGAPPPPPPAPTGATCASMRFFDADGSVFIDGEYVIKGVAGRILRSLVDGHVASGRTAFTNRELRLDRSLDLPGFKDNLESRLLLLKRRLDERELPVRIDKTGRGRFALLVERPIDLETITDRT